ncbi:MAG: VCBS domain-containing protein, partial [Gammaproteobacteria bacterium]
AIQALKTGDTLTDTIKVSSIDGTTQDMRISIRGADDASIINGTNTGRVTEDIDPDGDNMLEVSGKLTIVDPDSGDALFANAIHLGSYGELTIDSAGNWRYEANNNQASIQNLISGTSITDTLSVSSTSGATRDIVITIAGADEASTPANITLSWIAPVEREDGTPISMSEISGYRVYYGNVKGNYTNQVVINNSADMQVTLKNLAAGTYYIVVTAYDNDGRESAYSQEKSATI